MPINLPLVYTDSVRALLKESCIRGTSLDATTVCIDGDIVSPVGSAYWRGSVGGGDETIPVCGDVHPPRWKRLPSFVYFGSYAG